MESLVLTGLSEEIIRNAFESLLNPDGRPTWKRERKAIKNLRNEKRRPTMNH
jgi:hypothetical protein